jgi:hypothetical protein
MNYKSYWIHTVSASGGLGNVDRINEVLFGLVMVQSAQQPRDKKNFPQSYGQL